MNKRWMAGLLIVLCALSMHGCGAGFSSVTERTAPAGHAAVPIYPAGEELVSGSMPITLYYRYGDSDYLATQTVRLPLSTEQKVEWAVLERLIQGPVGEQYELTRVINQNTRVVDVREQRGYLEITLSGDFVALPPEMADISPEYPQFDNEEWSTRMRLAVTSVVDTITEMGLHAQVMIQIDEGSGPPRKLKRAEAGYTEQQGAEVGRLSRDAACILTAKRSATLALEALLAHDYEELYAWIAPMDARGESTPTLAQLREEMQGKTALIGYAIKDADTTVTADGQQATVMVNVSFWSADVGSGEYSDVPLRMVRFGEIWKVSYPSLRAMVSLP